jgi:uncharacterized membrane protein YphA (DoxX/SURF4 family)
MTQRKENTPMAATVERRAAFEDASASLALIRLTMGAMFLWVFIENYGKGLYTPAGYAGLINYYIQHGHAPALWKSVMAFMASHAALAAPLQGLTELSFGLLLVLGIASRAMALGVAGFLGSLWISELGTAWIWELLMPTMAALALSVGTPGRRWGLDAILARKFPGIPIW